MCFQHMGFTIKVVLLGCGRPQLQTKLKSMFFVAILEMNKRKNI